MLVAICADYFKNCSFACTLKLARVSTTELAVLEPSSRIKLLLCFLPLNADVLPKSPKPAPAGDVCSLNLSLLLSLPMVELKNCIVWYLLSYAFIVVAMRGVCVFPCNDWKSPVPPALRVLPLKL